MSAQRPAGTGARLARHALEWCERAMPAREAGRCGVNATRGEEAPDARSRARAARRHRRHGHDEGCAGIGAPLHELRRELRGVGPPEAAEFVAEAITDAARELALRGERWSAEDARQTLAEFVERRITPLPSSRASPGFVTATAAPLPFATPAGSATPPTHSEAPRSLRRATAAPARHAA